MGKSTLLNHILGLRLVAVSAKPQTTRNRILGVKNTQLPDEVAAPRLVQTIFVDTPGAQPGESALRKYMQKQTIAAAGDCDVAVVMLDVSAPSHTSPTVLTEGAVAPVWAAAQTAASARILALNKVDTLPDKQQLLPIIEAFGDIAEFSAIVPISAAKGSGVDQLERLVAERLPAGPKLFPEDMITDRAERFLAAEFIREQLFRQLGQELPYATAAEVIRFQERADRGDVVIDAEIHVERDSQKAIVIGAQGARIKSIGERARKVIGNLLGCQVHLRLHVRVSPNWSRGDRGIRRMGYD